MERTKNSISVAEQLPAIQTLSTRQLQILSSVLIARNNIANQLGVTFDGERNIYKALGYKLSLTFRDYLLRYTRHDISKAVIDRPVKATWQGQLELVETEEGERTPFEQAWYDLNKKFKLRSLFTRVDKLTGIGRYGVLLLGLDDVTNPEGFRSPVRSGKRKLKYIKPFSEASARISTWEDNPQSERYGLPKLYDIQVADVASNRSMSVQVHYTRVVHITDGNLESEVYGTPVLESVFNRMEDIEKLVGGSAEMFWKGARPGFQGMVDKDFEFDDASKEDLMDQVEEYENDLKRILINKGVDLKSLAQQISDPAGHMDVELTCVSAVTGIPKRMLSGSERGELASSQDAYEWRTFVQSRREDHAEPHIIEPFVTLLILYGILPRPAGDEWHVDWLDLFSISEKERVEIGKGRANAIREYTTNPLATSIMPPDAFFDLCLGLSTQQIQLVKSMIEKGISTEQEDLMEEMKELLEPSPAVTPRTQLPMSRSASPVAASAHRKVMKRTK